MIDNSRVHQYYSFGRKGFYSSLYLTTFAVYLPVSGQEAAKPLPEERPRAGSGRILVMDDEDAIRGLLVQILTLSGLCDRSRERRDRGYRAL